MCAIIKTRILFSVQFFFASKLLTFFYKSIAVVTQMKLFFNGSTTQNVNWMQNAYWPLCLHFRLATYGLFLFLPLIFLPNKGIWNEYKINGSLTSSWFSSFQDKLSRFKCRRIYFVLFFYLINFAMTWVNILFVDKHTIEY